MGTETIGLVHELITRFGLAALYLVTFFGVGLTPWCARRRPSFLRQFLASALVPALAGIVVAGLATWAWLAHELATATSTGGGGGSW